MLECGEVTTTDGSNRYIVKAGRVLAKKGQNVTRGQRLRVEGQLKEVTRNQQTLREKNATVPSAGSRSGGVFQKVNWQEWVAENLQEH